MEWILPNVPKRLTKQSIADAAGQLAARDPALGRILEKFGPPPLLRRPVTIGTMIHIILEQQVSVQAAKGTFDRFVSACQMDVTAERIRDLGTDHLRELGFSRQKARYALALADDCLEGRFRIDKLSKMDDAAARAEIVSRLGLGNWSADVFLMMALLRPDVFPVGDLALVKGTEEIDETSYSVADDLLSRAEIWRPYRSIATRMVWQWYVHKRGRDIF